MRIDYHRLGRSITIDRNPFFTRNVTTVTIVFSERQVALKKKKFTSRSKENTTRCIVIKKIKKITM